MPYVANDVHAALMGNHRDTTMVPSRAGKWETDVDRATEAQRLMKRRTSGREVDF